MINNNKNPKQIKEIKEIKAKATQWLLINKANSPNP
jgi:hypothetical protein